MWNKKAQNEFTEDANIPDVAQTSKGVTLSSDNYDWGFWILLFYRVVRSNRANRLRKKNNPNYAQNYGT